MNRIRLITALSALVLTPLALPEISSAQGNNMKIYNDILRQHNHPGAQKRFRDSDIEAPMLDVDEIVRREQQQRAQQQAQQRAPRKAPSNYPGCEYVGQMVMEYGCGIYGIQPCYCARTPDGTLHPQ